MTEEQKEIYSQGFEAAKLLVEKLYKAKADKWNALQVKIDRCYYNEDGSENTDPDMDLCVIGEYAAMAFGYL